MIALKIVRLKNNHQEFTEELNILTILKENQNPFLMPPSEWNIFTAEGREHLQYVRILLKFTLTEILNTYFLRLHKPMPIFYVKWYSYQLFSVVAHIHKLGITHR